MPERRNTNRRDFSYYMRVIDNRTQQVLGHMADISPRGFRIDSSLEILPGREYQVRLDVTSDIATKNFMVFNVISRWCRPDAVNPYTFNVGFELTAIDSTDMQIFQRMYEKYSTKGNTW